MIRKEPDQIINTSWNFPEVKSFNSHASWTVSWITKRFQMPLKANKVTHVSKLVWTITMENSQVDFSTTKHPRSSFVISQYCKLRVAATCDVSCAHWADAPSKTLNESPHVIPTSCWQISTKTLTSASLISDPMYQKSRGCGLQNCHPFLGVAII